MRVLGIGTTCDLASLYHRLAVAGHAVRVSIAEPMCHDVLAGIVPRVNDWRAELKWIREAGAHGLILFEDAVSGDTQDALRARGYRVVGGSAFGDRLEKDRAYGQRLLANHGLKVAETHAFDNVPAALTFLGRNPRRYALKFDTPDFGAAGTYVGQLDDARDMAAMLRVRARQAAGAPIRFILMDRIDGIEVGVGCWFDGTRWVGPPCLDWEHKRFFPGDLGEMTGEMGTVATFERSRTLFARTLEPLAPALAGRGHVGWVNLNTIVNADGVWPLEFTCRFGYPGYAVLEPLQALGWPDLLRGLAAGTLDTVPVRPGWSVGVMLTTRPFPYIRHHVPEPVGLPVVFDGALGPDDRAGLHYGEVGLDPDGQLVTAGYHGWTMLVTGTGLDPTSAQAEAYARARRLVIPNVRYRNDIGDRLIACDLAEMERLGFLDR